MKRLTDNQLMALMDLRDDEWRYGIHLRGRRALPSLKRLGLVFQEYRDHSAVRWKITSGGQDAVQHQATLRHYSSVPVSRVADRIDGYDRDDIGESPDY